MGGDLLGEAGRFGDVLAVLERPADGGGEMRPSLNDPNGEGEGELLFVSSLLAASDLFFLNMPPRRASAMLSLGTVGEADAGDAVTFIETPPIFTDDCMRR